MQSRQALYSFYSRRRVRSELTGGRLRRLGTLGRLATLACLVVLVVGLVGAQSAPLATFVVTNTDDTGAGSLRQAILSANATENTDTIEFNIPGSGVHTITPLSELPHLLQPTVLDGTTESDYVAGGAPRIEINGASTDGAIGIWVEGANSTIRGLTINRFDGNGIYIAGTAANTQVEANYVGLGATGALDAGNGNGIQVLSAGNTIGGSTSAERNVVSGNDGTAISIPGGTATVQGNYIGTTADGLSPLGNDEGITLVSGGNTIGGPNSGEGNVLSGSLTTTGFGAGVSFVSATRRTTPSRATSSGRTRTGQLRSPTVAEGSTSARTRASTTSSAATSSRATAERA